MDRAHALICDSEILRNDRCFKRHNQLDRITANELCKQAGIPPKYLVTETNFRVSPEVIVAVRRLLERTAFR